MPNPRITVAVCLILLALAAPGSTIFAQKQPQFAARFDLTANGVIDGADAATAAVAWSDLNAGDGCTVAGALDMNGDGCLDVVDVQQVASAVGAAAAEARLEAAPASTLWTWTVTANNLLPDSSPGNGVCRTEEGRCSLRAAIEEANRSVGPDLIVFDVRRSDGSCPDLVRITAPLDPLYQELVIDDPRGDGTTIDGYTQCGASPNTGELAGNAVIKVELQGNFTLGINGLLVLSSNNVVRGLAIYNWDRQIELFGQRARHNRIEGNFLGTNAAQTHRSRGMGTHHSEGLRIQIGPTHNVVGCGSFAPDNSFVPCSDPAQVYAARNIVAGNGNDGIHLERQVFYNRIVGNYVGMKQDGVTALKNLTDGVDIEQGPQHNWLGGESALERNVISGNGSEGLEISHGTWTKFNKVVGNYFGLDAGGTRAVGNTHNGVSFEDRVDQNEAYNNVVAANGRSGFRFYILATRNIVRNNSVGLAADGQTPRPNREHGVHVMGGSQHNRIVENVVAHNIEHGMFLSSTSDSIHNYIGETYYNTLSRNRIFNNNGRGIAFQGKRGIHPNQNLAAPTILRANERRVEGTTCAGCRVELFVADRGTLTAGGRDESGQGATFVGDGRADGAGYFNFAIAPQALGQVLTATTTDQSGNTSPFARNIATQQVAIEDIDPVPVATSTPGPSPTAGPGEAPDNSLFLPIVRQ